MSSNLNKSEVNQPQTLILKPKLTGFFLFYILFSLPGFLISLTVLGLVLILSILSISSFFVSKDSLNQLNLTETRGGSDDNGVLVYKMNGEILSGGSDLSSSSRQNNIYTDIVASDFKQIKANSKIKNVVIDLNTPGGEVGAAKTLGDQLENLRKYLGKDKLTFYYDGLTASGGLYATCKTSNQIVGSKYGETGSIGVIMTLPNYKGTAEKIGYSETVIKSSDTKDIGNPFRDPTKKEVDFFQTQVNDEFKSFKDCVASGRKIDPKKVDEFANGLVYQNPKAKDYGLVDEVDDLDRAVRLAASDSNLGNNYKVWEIKAETSVLQNLLSAKSFEDLTKFTKATTNLTDRLASLDAGRIYAIDENRL
jgi:protease-4